MKDKIDEIMNLGNELKKEKKMNEKEKKEKQVVGVTQRERSQVGVVRVKIHVFFATVRHYVIGCTYELKVGGEPSHFIWL